MKLQLAPLFLYWFQMNSQLFLMQWGLFQVFNLSFISFYPSGFIKIKLELTGLFENIKFIPVAFI